MKLCRFDGASAEHEKVERVATTSPFRFARADITRLLDVGTRNRPGNLTTRRSIPDLYIPCPQLAKIIQK